MRWFQGARSQACDPGHSRPVDSHTVRQPPILYAARDGHREAIKLLAQYEAGNVPRPEEVLSRTFLFVSRDAWTGSKRGRDAECP